MLVNGDIDLLAGLALKENRIGLIGYPDLPMGNESLNLIKHNTDDSITAEHSTLNSRQLTAIDSHCFGIRIGNEGLLRLVNRGMNIIGTEAIKDLAYRYASELYQETFADMIGSSMPLIGTSIIIIASLIIFFLYVDSHRKKKEIAITTSAREELEEKNAKLAESQQALSNALIAAEHANNAKTAFLNNMSHDIRTPMNAIVGFTAMAAAHIDNKEQVQDYLAKPYDIPKMMETLQTILLNESKDK